MSASNQHSIRDAERSPYRELELLFQASRSSPLLHEAAVTVEQYLRAFEEAQQFPVETVMSWKRRADQADAQLAAVRLLLDPERQDEPDEENVLRAFEAAGGRLS